MFEHTKTAVSAGLKIPKDVYPGEPIVTVMGRQGVHIENYRGISLYDDSVIKLQARTCRIIVSGKRLTIAYYTDEEMQITGQIQSVVFES